MKIIGIDPGLAIGFIKGARSVVAPVGVVQPVRLVIIPEGSIKSKLSGRPKSLATAPAMVYKATVIVPPLPAKDRIDGKGENGILEIKKIPSFMVELTRPDLFVKILQVKGVFPELPGIEVGYLNGPQLFGNKGPCIRFYPTVQLDQTQVGKLVQVFVYGIVGNGVVNGLCSNLKGQDEQKDGAYADHQALRYRAQDPRCRMLAVFTLHLVPRTLHPYPLLALLKIIFLQIFRKYRRSVFNGAFS